MEWLAAGRSVGDIAFSLGSAPSLRCSGRLAVLLPDNVSKELSELWCRTVRYRVRLSGGRVLSVQASARERTLAAPQDWSTLRLDHEEADILADAAHVLRFGDNEGETTTPIGRNSYLFPAGTTTAPMISGPCGTWFRKTPSKAGCVAWAATISAGRAV